VTALGHTCGMLEPERQPKKTWQHWLEHLYNPFLAS
jgi:hypothetical protein